MVNWDRHKQQPQYDPPSWIEWQPSKPFRYLFMIFMVLFILPSLFGLILTPFGVVVNILFVDWFMYKRETSFINYD
tara:strand:- start:87 stop:314 length:228 start_codon:yes stop_codon:yes gene_type:complete